jgi:hypothetical protein
VRRAPAQVEPSAPRPRRELPRASIPKESHATVAPPAETEDGWSAALVLGAAFALVAAVVGSALPLLRRSERESAPIEPAPHPALISEVAPLEEGACEIEWFRGYVKSRFYVVLDEPELGGDRLVESPWFSWRQADPPPPALPEIVAARDALLVKLEREGWEAYGRGGAWYSQRLALRQGT